MFRELACPLLLLLSRTLHFCFLLLLYPPYTVPDVTSSSTPTTVATSVSHSSTRYPLASSVDEQFPPKVSYNASLHSDVTSSSILSMTLVASPSPMTTFAAIPMTVVTSVSPSNAASSRLASSPNHYLYLDVIHP